MGTDQQLAMTSGMKRQLKALCEQFAQRFQRSPTVAACAPGRINLIGEHTDYNDGFVLPMAIDRQTIVAGAPARAGMPSRLVALDVNEAIEIDLTASFRPRPGTAVNYLLGVAHQFAKRGMLERIGNLDVAVTSTVPIGAGLASSAALEVAFATLLEQFARVKLEPLAKALLCRAAEHEFPGTPCGLMDMLVATVAQPGKAVFIDCRSNQWHAATMPDPGETAVLIVDTDIRHEHASGAYARRREECEAAARSLGVPALRDATIAMVKSADLSDIQRRRATHVVAENSRTVLAAEALAGGDLIMLGELMFSSHRSLRDLFDVSCPELDVLVETAHSMRGRGVFGARMTGGGFGGCAVVLAWAGALTHIQDRLSAAWRDHCGREPSMFTTTAAAGAHALPAGSGCA